LLLVLSCQYINAQKPLGTWSSYLPYNQAKRLAISEGKVYCVTEGGLFYYNTTDNSINKIGREDGLSDVGISVIAYSKSADVLLVAYENANLDLIYGNEIFNISDIKRQAILGDKGIYDVYFIGNYAYLACGFGLVTINLEKREIKETTYFYNTEGAQLRVDAISSFNDTLYCITDEGLFKGSLQGVNLIDFNNWELVDRFSGGTSTLNTIASDDDYIYVNVNNPVDEDTIYRYNGSKWSVYQWYSSNNIRYLNTKDNQLIIVSGFDVDVYSQTGEKIKHYYIGSPRFADIDDNDILYVADKIRGLMKIPNGWEKISLYPEGPAGINVNSIEIENGKLLAVPGGIGSSMKNLYRNAEVYTFSENKWRSWKEDSIKDLIQIAIDPDDTTHYFAASWGYGLLEFQNNKLTEVYLDQNSTLRSVIPGQKFFRLGGICFDHQKNLWVTNSAVENPLSVLKADGTWKSFSLNNELGSMNLGDIITTQQGYKWFILSNGNGLFVYNDNGTIDNEDDDEFKKISVKDENNKVITNDIYSIAEDKDGNIWLGTSQGIVVYYNPGAVFTDDPFYARIIIVPRNDGSDLGDPLLGTETVTSIEVDGANRKWLGTKNAGAFLVSDDGLEQIYSFNVENSPILSNTITDIAINDQTGEVVFGTAKGIISYMNEATEPDDLFRDVYVFPNPVREDYDGDIVISGLIEDTYLKITDLNGNLVAEMKSLGGRAVWDGTNLHNERVHTGVYLVFCSNQDGSLTHVTKLLFIH